MKNKAQFENSVNKLTFLYNSVYTELENKINLIIQSCVGVYPDENPIVVQKIKTIESILEIFEEKLSIISVEIDNLYDKINLKITEEAEIEEREEKSIVVK